MERTLLDRAAGTRGTFSGVVRFFARRTTAACASAKRAPCAGRLGRRTFTGPATREYLLRPADTPDAMDMFFPDGRPFHRMSFAPDASQDQHWCDPDTYRVTYIRHGPDEFGYVWDVTGPRKDLLLESVLRRLPQPLRRGLGSTA